MSTRVRPARVERRDAVENREKILGAAAHLMARRGYGVPLTEIAEAAGVGVGTFYRGFPDRAALLDELQRRGYALLLDTLAGISSPGRTGADAIEAYLTECLRMADQLVALPLRGGEPLTDGAAVDGKGRIGDAIDTLLAAGRADGSVRDDVTALDVIVCGTLIASPLPHGPHWPEAARRHLVVFMRGVRG